MRPGPVYFLHVSSSGGSTICRWAQQQRCARVPSCGANCNLNCAHPWDWRSGCHPPACPLATRSCKSPHRPGCTGLHRYLQRHNITFFASETMLHRKEDDALCAEFRHVALLRHPVERVRRQLERMSSTPNIRLREMLSSPFVFNTSERTSLMGTPAVNNYLARLLLGSAAFFLPLRALNDSHCDVASDLLARFEVVVPLDQVTRLRQLHVAA